MAFDTLRIAFVALAFGAACGPERLIASDAEEVDLLAVLERDESGRLKSTSFERWSGGAIGLSATSPAILAGFTEEQLAPYTIDLSRPLVEVSGCAPSLPPPIWAASWDNHDFAQIEPNALPRLTGAGIERGCPDPNGVAIYFEPSCEDRFCATTVNPRGPCLFEADIGCELGTVLVSVDPLGEICIDRSHSNVPEGCELSPFVGQIDPPPPFEIAEHQLFPAEPWVHPVIRTRDYLAPRHIRAGYAYDLVVLDDRAVVSANDGGVGETCPSGGDRNRKIHLIDLETAEAIQTATAPSCLDRLARDPIGDGFIGAFAVNEQWHLGRFDREGNVLQSIVVSPAFHDYKVFGIESPDPSTIAVLLTIEEPFRRGPLRSIVTIHDAATLEERAMHGYEVGPRVAIAVIGEGRLGLASHEPRIAHVLDVDLGQDAWLAEIGGDFPFWHTFFDVLPGRAPGDMMITGSFAASIYSVVDDGSTVLRSDAYPVDAFPLTAARWPLDPDRFLVGLIGVGTDATWLAFFDAAEPAFLPAAWKVGHGPVLRIDVDRAGRSWLLLPWSATVLRVSPHR